MNDQEILQDFETKFKEIKKELGFKASLEDLDEIFFIRDFILQEGFVSCKLSRQICSRISETYMHWNGYLHGLVFPNPNSMLNLNESQMFDEDSHREIMKLMAEVMTLVSTNTLIGISKNKELESRFIDDTLTFWKTNFKPKVTNIMTKVAKGWKEKVNEKIE